MNETPLHVRSFGTALWLAGKGYEPLRAQISRDGGGIVFLFSPAARDAMDDFYSTKDTLSRMQEAARHEGAAR